MDVSTIPQSTRSGYTRCMTERQLIYSRVSKLAFSYLLLDFLSVFMMKDPYFILGPDTSRVYTMPSYLQSLSSWKVLFYRELLSLAGVWSAILAVFNLSDLVQYFICKFVFPSRAALWNHASTFGSFSQVLDRGLAGWWGAWWHQSFRLEFLGPLAYLIRKGYVQKGSKQALYVGLLFSFVQSGLMHGAGSLTSVPETKLWRSMVFFLLQGAGIAVQHKLISWLRRRRVSMPRVTAKAGNLVFTLLWLYVTAPPFIDDLASTGLWLLEPVPISPLRWLGLGHPADHWWRWDMEQLPKLYRPQHWWEIGIAL